ncbi:MAG: hypothetical protein DHS20C14_02190 [Phycisphaeraceae bacterium]|nr:MAG: hypothetical protein DHS20C14_02190 [Phycisphaeraceae bacterium]
MGEVKPWQAVLFVVAILVVGVGLAWMIFGGKSVNLPDRLYFIDVPSGELYVADVSGRRGMAIPAMHPETRERTLVPIIRDDEGEWRIGEHYLPAIEEMGVEPASSIDPDTWAVPSAQVRSAKKYKSPLQG